MGLKIIVTLGWLLAFGVGCSETATQGFTGHKRGDRTSDQAKTSDTKLGDIQIEEEEDEQVLADEPVMINGAFLTCAVDSALADDKDQGIGCRVENDRGKKLPISDDVKDEVEVLDAYNDPIDFKIESPSQSSRWHWHLIVDRVSLEGAQVQLDLVHQPSGHRRIKMAAIDTRDVQDDELLIEDYNQFFSKMAPYHVGDNNYRDNANGSCEEEIESIGLSGKSIKIPFTVDNNGTRIGINIGGVCGINRVGSYAEVTKRDGEVVDRVNFTINADNVAFPGFKAKAGKYYLELHSHLRRGDFDDYMVREVIIRADDSITIGDVVSEKASKGFFD